MPAQMESMGMVPADTHAGARLSYGLQRVRRDGMMRKLHK
jgi:hypothetical protein